MDQYWCGQCIRCRQARTYAIIEWELHGICYHCFITSLSPSSNPYGSRVTSKSNFCYRGSSSSGPVKLKGRMHGSSICNVTRKFEGSCYYSENVCCTRLWNVYSKNSVPSPSFIRETFGVSAIWSDVAFYVVLDHIVQSSFGVILLYVSYMGMHSSCSSFDPGIQTNMLAGADVSFVVTSKSVPASDFYVAVFPCIEAATGILSVHTEADLTGKEAPQPVGILRSLSTNIHGSSEPPRIEMIVSTGTDYKSISFSIVTGWHRPQILLSMRCIMCFDPGIVYKTVAGWVSSHAENISSV